MFIWIITLFVLSFVVIISADFLTQSSTIKEKDFNKEKYQKINTDYVIFELPKYATHYWNQNGDDLYEVIIHNFSIKNNSDYILKVSWEDERYIQETLQIHYRFKDKKLKKSDISFNSLEKYNRTCLMELSQNITKPKKECEKAKDKFKLKFKKSEIELGTLEGYEYRREFNNSCLYNISKEYGNESNNNLDLEINNCYVKVSYPIYSWEDFPSNGIEIDNLPSDFIAIDDVNISECGIINTENQIYNLNKSLTSSAGNRCLEIEANNITINLNKFNITGVDRTAVYLPGYNYTTIINGSIYGFSYAIFSENNSNNLTINNINVFNSTNRGFVLRGQSNRISNVTLKSHRFYSIYLSHSNNNIITNITTSDSVWYSLYLLDSSNNKISNINASVPTGIGIVFGSGSNHNIFTDIVITDANQGITDTTNPEININNTFEGIDISEYGLAGISLVSSLNNTFKNGNLSRPRANVHSVFIEENTNIKLSNIFINISYNTSKETVESDGELIRKWYFDSNVNDTSSNTINQANVSGKNVTEDTEFSVLTGSNGLITQQQLIEYINNGGTKTYHTPHNITTTKTGFISNATNYNLTITNNIKHNVQLVPTILITIDSPKPESISFNESIELNYSITNFTAIDTCLFFVTNSTGDIMNLSGEPSIETQNTTITNCLNTTFNLTRSDTYTLNLFVNETGGFVQNKTVDFGISLESPAVVLDSPLDNARINRLNNISFNFTAIDGNGLDTCNLYGNWTGTFEKNFTWFPPESGVQNFTLVNLTEGTFIWNVFCNDTLDNGAYALNNFTLIIDTTQPNITINDIRGTDGSQTATFNATIVDKNLDTCWYSIFNSSSGIDGNNNNVTFICNNEISITTTAFATYSLTIYANDSANNENSTTSQFIISPSESGDSPGGGGVSETIIILVENVTWTMETEQEGDVYELEMASLSVSEKYIYFKNTGTKEVKLNLTCEGDLCDFLTLSKDNVTLPVGLTIKTAVGVVIRIPREVENKVYTGNIIAIDKDGVKKIITIKSRVGGLGYIGLVFDKLFSLKRFGDGTIPLPYHATMFLIIWVIIGFLSYVIILKKAFGGKVWSGFIGLFLGLISIIFIP